MTSTHILSSQAVEKAFNKIGLILFSTSIEKDEQTHYLVQTRHQSSSRQTSGLNRFSHIRISGKSTVSSEEAFRDLLEKLEYTEVWIKDRSISGDDEGEIYLFNKEEMSFEKKELVLAERA